MVNSNSKTSSKRFVWLVLISLFFHAGSYEVYRFITKDEAYAAPVKQYTIQLLPEKKEKSPQVTNVRPLQKMQPELPVSKKEESPEIEHAPIDNGEEFSSNNQSDKSVDKLLAGGGTEANTEKFAHSVDAKETDDPYEAENSQLKEIQEAQLTKSDDSISIDSNKPIARELLSTTGVTDVSVSKAITESSKLQSSKGAQSITSDIESQLSQIPLEFIQPTIKDVLLAIPDEFMDGVGNLKLLSEADLRNADVVQPFSEQKSREIQMANKYLERMNKQVATFWNNPYQGGRMLRGIIKIELGANGYLKEAYVFRSSGNKILDYSVLDAIKSVPRYEVPSNPIIAARYYAQLSFHFSSIEQETELMPFEKEGYAQLN
jgi:hypothetical protein